MGAHQQEKESLQWENEALKKRLASDNSLLEQCTQQRGRIAALNSQIEKQANDAQWFTDETLKLQNQVVELQNEKAKVQDTLAKVQDWAHTEISKKKRRIDELVETALESQKKMRLFLDQTAEMQMDMRRLASP